MPETNEPNLPAEATDQTDSTELTEAIKPTEEPAPEPQSKSLFLAAARAMDDFVIRQRIQTAVLFQAKGLLDKSGNARNYAVHAVMNPQELDPTMMALVLVDEAIASKVRVDEDGGRVDTSEVPDETILGSVQAAWDLVAFKYTRDPLEQAG